MMKSYPLSNILEVFKKLKYVYNTKPYMLNIVGIRVNEVPNTFDDTMVVFWKDNNNVWNKREYPITTDTGTFWLNNPMEKKLGSGMMKEGQYLDTYKIGKHKGNATDKDGHNEQWAHETEQGNTGRLDRHQLKAFTQVPKRHEG